MNHRRTTIFSGLAAVIAAVAVVLVGTSIMHAADDAKRTEPTTQPATVSVKLYNAAGELVGPIEVSSLHLPEADWQKSLSKEQCYVLRSQGTEAPGSGELLHNKTEGVYVCAACRLPLYISDAKFESGTGWPSFFQPIYKGNVREINDDTHGMVRTEVECARCGGHLGHVFEDGPAPSGLRYCMNSVSLKFVTKDNLKSLADPAASNVAPATQLAK